MGYALSNQGGKWIAEGSLDSGRAVRFEVGDGTLTKEAAEAVAEMKWAARLQRSAASNTRWARDRAAAGGAAASSPARSSGASAERAAEIRQKLIAAGDAKSIPPEEGDDVDDQADDDEDDVDEEEPGQAAADEDKPDYIPPGERKEDAEEEEEGEDDEEAAELLADTIGNGIWTGVTGGVTKVCKHMKPPREPGEPHELFVKFGREGCVYRMRKLIGKGAKLSPNAKLAIGLAGTIITMLWGSEVIEEKPAEKRGAANGQATDEAKWSFKAKEAAPPAHANGVAPKNPPKLALVRTPAPPDEPPEDPIGSFS